MARRDDGGAAFPRPASIDTSSGTLPDGDEVVEEQRGMSLRDWFAGRALSGWLADPSAVELSIDEITTKCWEAADLMIEKRSQL
jgi:hypothetical protein